MLIIPFRPSRGITGLYFSMPEQWQRRRVSELARTLSVETVAALTHGSYCEVVAINNRCAICGAVVDHPWLWLCRGCNPNRPPEARPNPQQGGLL